MMRNKVNCFNLNQYDENEVSRNQIVIDNI